jgi:hypothetical protein
MDQSDGTPSQQLLPDGLADPFRRSFLMRVKLLRMN